MLKRTVMTLTVAALACAATPAEAQETATILLRSGETVHGQLLDMGGVGFTINVNGEERRIPTNDVAVIDFTGNPSEINWNSVTGEPHVVLRNGEKVEGRLYDIGGTTPLRITLRSSAGERNISSSEVGRIVLARPTNAPAASATATTGSGAGSGAGIVVPANQRWVATGLTVNKGETLRVNTTGEIRLSNDQNDIAGPAGARSQRFAPNSPLPRNFAGALIGRIGTSGQPFAIGDMTSVQMPESGQLFLGINDDNLSDNQGEYRVEIQRTTGSPIRRR
jgi:hypothetical protein